MNLKDVIKVIIIQACQGKTQGNDQSYSYKVIATVIIVQVKVVTKKYYLEK